MNNQEEVALISYLTWNLTMGLRAGARACKATRAHGQTHAHARTHAACIYLLDWRKVAWDLMAKEQGGKTGAVMKPLGSKVGFHCSALV